MQHVRRRRRSLTPLLAVLAPLLLVLGVWLGGHPANLPGFARDALLGDDEGRLYDEALDTISQNYFRPVDRDKLLDEGLTAGVASLDDRFSHYFDPKAYHEFQEATDGAFEGVGMNVSEVERGLKVLTVFDGSPAQRGGIRAGDVITAVDNKATTGPDSLFLVTLTKHAGDRVAIDYVRDGRAARTELTLAATP